MTLSPLIILILLLFLMLVGVLFLLWSFLTLRTSSPSPQKQVVVREPKRKTQPRTERQNKKRNIYSNDSKNTLKERLEHQMPNASTEPRPRDTQGGLSNNHTRGHFAANIPTPTAPPVEAKVTKKHIPQIMPPLLSNDSTQDKVDSRKTAERTTAEKQHRPEPSYEYKQEALSPTTIIQPAKTDDVLPNETREKAKAPPKFVLIETDEDTADTQLGSDAEEVPLFQGAKKAKQELEEQSSEEDAFDKFIKSKNDNLDF